VRNCLETNHVFAIKATFSIQQLACLQIARGWGRRAVSRLLQPFLFFKKFENLLDVVLKKTARFVYG